MDSIFKEWQKKLSDFESSVKKDLKDIRKCKAEIQKMKEDTEFEKRRGRYIRDDERIILSAPEIIIGNVDESGMHFDSAGSTVIVRSSKVGLQGLGDGGMVEMRSPSIRQIAEDPGSDGQEHVVLTRSEVVSQARHIVLHSQAAEGVFSQEPAYPGTTGVRIHADEKIEIDASVSNERHMEDLTMLFEKLKKRQIELEEQSARHKVSLGLMVTMMEKLLDDKKKMGEKDNAVRACYEDMEQLNGQIEQLSLSLSEEVCSYADVLSILSETSRQLKCVDKQKGELKDGATFKKEPTGASVAVTGEVINIETRDGDKRLRENPDSAINLVSRTVELLSTRDDGQLFDDGQVTLSAKSVVVDTTTTKDPKFDDNNGDLVSAQCPVDGQFSVSAKTVTLTAVNQEIKDGVYRDKDVAADSKITLWAHDIDVNTSKLQNVDTDKEGKITQAEYLADGEVVINSKTITVGAVDSEFDASGPHQRKEKALTEGSRLQLRSERMAMNASTTDRKATGAIVINAKEVGLKAIDTVDHKQSLSEGGKIKTVAEQISLGESKDEKLMSQRVQAWAEKITLLGSKVMQAIQGEKKSEDKAFLLLKDQEAKLKGKKAELHGPTEVVGDTTLHKTTLDDIKVQGEFKSNYLSGGVTAGPSPKSTLTPDTDELKD